jgi:hypothetical protein
MNGVIIMVIRKTVSIPTDDGKTQKAMRIEIIETKPPIMNIHVGCLIAVLTDTNLSSTILK